MANTKVQSKGLTTTGVGAGSYTSASITVDAQGRVTAASSGSAGAGMGILTRFTAGPASGTHTAAPTANRLGVYMVAGGGPGGNPGANASGTGGKGGFGFYNAPITQPFAQPFSVGAGAGNTNLTNVGTVNAGNAGSPGPFSPCSNPGADGNPGTAPGAAVTLGAPVNNMKFLIGSPTAGTGNLPADSGYGAGGGSSPSAPARAGSPGLLVIFENTGT